MGVTVLRLGQLPVGAGADMPPRSIKAPAEATLGRHYGLKSIRSVLRGGGGIQKSFSRKILVFEST